MKGAVGDGVHWVSGVKAMQDHGAMARGNKPSLLEIRTYRYRGHSMSDPQKYRTKQELEAKKDEDPIVRLKIYILDKDITSGEALDGIDDDV